MMWDVAAAAFSEFLDAIGRQFLYRDPMDWFLFLFPIVIVFEIPRYYLPMWGLLFANMFGLIRKDSVREKVFLRQAPLVSVIVAGRNEEDCIAAAIQSLLDQDYPNLEIIVVDDHSDDGMYEKARHYERQGLIRLVRNNAARGRGGRPMATNLGLRMANGEFLVSVDADCSFDRNLIEKIIAPFADPRVGVVAGNILARNQEVNLITQLQAFEYAVAIDLRKRWSDLFGCTLQASGALGAFRRSAVQNIGGWDPELAEDGDISLRLIKAGWKIKFADEAVALTNVPETFKVLEKQRTRWDRGTLRTYFMKHGRLLRPSLAGWSYALEIWSEFAFFVVASLAYPFFIIWLLTKGLGIFAFVMIASLSLYGVLSVLTLIPMSLITTRLDHPWSLLPAALLNPIYKEVFRWVRIRALVMELLRLNYKDSFLPDSAWNQAPRF